MGLKESVGTNYSIQKPTKKSSKTYKKNYDTVKTVGRSVAKR